MKLITIDFETHYDMKDYSLSKMQTDAYVNDERFQTIGFAIKVDDRPTQWFANSEDDATAKFVLGRIDWADAAVICQNTLFDGYILTQRYGIRPKLWMDTLGMSRMLYPWERKHSLEAQALFMQMPTVKGDAVARFSGYRLADFNPVELETYGEYCKNDVNLTYGLAQKYLPRVPVLELRLIDMTIRMFTEPQLVGDIALMDKLYVQEVARKDFLLNEGDVSKETIMSNAKFAEELLARGCLPPTKISPKTGKVAYAFAKSDKDFIALLEHEDSEVQALVAARLGVKTTIAETRALRFAQTARRGALPVYLNYWGAKATGRYSGGNQCLVGDTEITVLRNEQVLCIILSQLLPADLVWDGDEFVAHGGLLFQGYAEVIAYDGVTGTEDHKVWVEGQDAPVGLGAAAAGGYRIQTRRSPSSLESTAEVVPECEGSVYEPEMLVV